jgi:GntR family transcriptional repressor for pyruvate dehydrogenase complex
VAFEAVRKSTAPEIVVEQILKKLQSGEITTGARLPSQRELALSFGVGRSSMREALNALAVMGYLDVQQGRGTFIAQELPGTSPSISKLQAALKAGSLLDVIELRETLECKADSAERAESLHLRRLNQALRDMEDSRENYRRFLQADVEFHTTLAEATTNQIFSEILRFLLEKVVGHHETFKTTLISLEYRSRSIHTLKQVLACVKREDGRGAAEWMREHLNAIRRELRHYIATARCTHLHVDSAVLVAGSWRWHSSAALIGAIRV